MSHDQYTQRHSLDASLPVRACFMLSRIHVLFFWEDNLNDSVYEFQKGYPFVCLYFSMSIFAVECSVCVFELLFEYSLLPAIAVTEGIADTEVEF